jgi:hypothetical protein
MSHGSERLELFPLISRLRADAPYLKEPNMRLLIAPIAIAVAFVAFSHDSFGRGLGKLVTKANQKEIGLEYELSAIREPEAVIVSMTIPLRGQLQDLRIVRLGITAENGKNFLVRAPLQMSKKSDGVHVSAQIAPGLVENASLDLVLREGRREFYYAVRVADYVTERGQ